MNIKFLILILFGGAGISTIGILSNDIAIDVQSFEVFDSVETFTGGFVCACENPNLPGDYSADFCDVTYAIPPDPNDPNDPGVPNPNSLGAVGNHLCTWETSENDYGDGLGIPICNNNQRFDGNPFGIDKLDCSKNTNPTVTLSNEGCSADFWQQHSDPRSANYVWPPGYEPYREYNDIFLMDMDGIGKGHQIHDDDKEKGKGHDKDDDSYTLMDALSENSDSPKGTLLKESVASILNSAHSDVDYPYKVKEVILFVNNAQYGEELIKTINELQKRNNAGESSLCS